MKGALLLCGQYREFEIAAQSWEFIKEFDLDVYVSTWDYSKQENKFLEISIEEDVTEEMIRKYLPNANISILKQSDYYFYGEKQYHNNKQTFHWKNALKMVKESGVEYDVMFLTRPDHYITFSIDKNSFYGLTDPEVIYAHTNIYISGINQYFLPDAFFMGNYKNMVDFIEATPDNMIGNIHTEIARVILSIGKYAKFLDGIDIEVIRPNVRTMVEKHGYRDDIRNAHNHWNATMHIGRDE